MPTHFSIVVFAVIAAFVLFQLYNVLGKKVGRQPQEDAKTPVAAGPGAPADGAPRAPALDAAALAAVAGLKARDPSFDPARFLDGARQAYETIVRGYAAGDREALRPLLTPAVMTSFEAGMAARETRGETEQVEFVHPPRADLEVATAEGERAVARVRFLAELRSRLTKGEAETVDERRTAENWTFERALGAADPNWVLARVEPASA
ncbi:MAG TPA: TIM44-related membrane protein TimA [Brevundimonas sp.]|uniref:TIM44-related membrane protein TimA n=1 Tax=Brevundimonas sp. TaxID=1871086 RepID=UPI00260BA1B5|nr:TIM44-related membrane protein TimA [Brevundimonas sp.]HRO33358.1 TIM44-related membrane protein TimA [Brevundimonas sp.]